MNKKEPDFNVDNQNLHFAGGELNKEFSLTFIQNLLDNFKDGAYHFLEAKRICNSNNRNLEIQTIKHEEHLPQRFDRLKDLFPFKQNDKG